MMYEENKAKQNKEKPGKTTQVLKRSDFTVSSFRIVLSDCPRFWVQLGINSENEQKHWNMITLK